MCGWTNEPSGARPSLMRTYGARTAAGATLKLADGHGAVGLEPLSTWMGVDRHAAFWAFRPGWQAEMVAAGCSEPGTPTHHPHTKPCRMPGGGRAVWPLDNGPLSTDPCTWDV